MQQPFLPATMVWRQITFRPLSREADLARGQEATPFDAYLHPAVGTAIGT